MITTSTAGRFLIIQTAFIGDVILATALLEQLHAQFPAARLDMLVRQGNEGLLKNHPFLNEILIWEKKKRKYGSLWALLKQIRRTRYDSVINLQRFGATGALTAFSGAGETIGYDKNPFARFFTRTVPHRIQPGVHEVDRNAGLIAHLMPEPLRLRPKLYPSAADYAAVAPYQTGPYVCMAPTSVWYTKQFPREKWVELIGQLPVEYTIYLLGAPSDSNACDWIVAETRGRRPVISLTGKLSLLQSAALMQGAAMNYVNDSAPMHLCSALNAPTTAIFCSTVPDFGFGPLADDSRILETKLDLDCRPCGLHGYKKCPLGHFNCAYSIDVQGA
ncbi:glycosyltransferase family 9 protein [Arsenicibacter rosenii]|uniref:Heptosyltransferase n=1 Tax=Arsenicibacter rosenii TaxID=1750698 RepID=A0A1S2VPP3_9BACT|nr:glycosyltransferase family 9 protein [Arsenicibacter rosenii]OIN60205.1 heptosyltransferase [Arsenicibacter rosenii]